MMTKRMISILLSVLIMVLAVPVAQLAVAADDNVVYDVQAEDFPGGNIGARMENHLVCMKGSGSEWCMFGTELDLDPGEYQVVFYMLITELPDSPNIVMNDFVWIPEGESSLIEGPKTNIDSSHFKELNQYYAVTVDLTLSTAVSDLQIRVWYYNTTTVVFDRVMMVKKGTELPAPEEFVGGQETPYDGESYDTYTVPLTEDGLKMISETSGKFVDGRVEFRKSADTAGGISGLQEKVHLTSGAKFARIYLRTPTKAIGAYTFLTVMVVEADMPIYYRLFTGDDLKAFTNQTYIIECAFNANPNKALDVIISWQGNNDLIIDRIDFSDQRETSVEEKLVKATQEDDGYYAEFVPADLEQISIIDQFKIQTDRTEVFLPAAYLSEWFAAGYTKVRVDLDNLTDGAVADNLKSTIDSYDISTTQLGLFDFSVTLMGDGVTNKLKSLPSAVKIRTVLTNQIILQFGTGKKISLVYSTDQDDHTQMLVSTLDDRQRFVEFSMADLGAVISCVADLS